MKLNLDVTQPFRWAYNNPRQASQKAAQGVISLMVGYVAYKEGRELYGQSSPISCHCSYSASNLLDYGTKLMATAALCLASVVIFRYNRVKPLPKIPGSA